MTVTDEPVDVTWDIDTLLGDADVGSLLAGADSSSPTASAARGTVASLDAEALAAHLRRSAELQEAVGRAAAYAMLRYSADTTDAEAGALLQQVTERNAAIETRLLFFELEWAALDDDHVARLVDDPVLAFARHHLVSLRRYRDHLLSEPEERILTEKQVTGSSAWSRLFDELTSTISVELPADGGATRSASLEEALSLLASPDREVRQRAAEAVTVGLEPGLRTRAFVFNTLLADKATDDRLRSYPSWVASRNLSNEASDESVQALIDAVVGRYDIPQRWYGLKSELLGYRLADFDRGASIAESETMVGWGDARELVLDAYASFSGELADVARRFFDERWIDAPVRPGKRPGAFCHYTVPSHHPYVHLNWTGRQRDVLTLAHELGHGLHGYLSRGQGVFHQWTPLTLAETASVFGETVTFGRLFDQTTDPGDRLALLASEVEGSIATVFRQVSMNRFEHAVHTERREVGELSVDRFNELWAGTQTELFGESVEVTEGYRSWWSYIPHFIGTPGYVYAYAYGQLLALSVYARYEERGADFVPAYLELLSSGGSMPPEELGRIVDCDLADPGFWDAGLEIVSRQVDEAEAAATAAGRR
ncbi:MAG: M3 family oligoendopeptidase [Actinomycetota bacterium]